MKSGRPTVAIYRDVLLKYSETFIAAQTAALERWTPLFVGTGTSDGIPLPAESMEVLHGASAKVRFKLLRSVPRAWLDAIRGHEPRLVHAHFGPDGFWAIPLARELQIPLIVTFHGFDATSRAGANPMLAAYIALRPSIFRAAARVVAVSRFIAGKLMAAGCPAEKIVVHHIGVDTELFAATTGPHRERVVLFVGRLVEKKGCQYLLRAMAHVQRRQPDIGLVIIGDGPLRASLDSEARSIRNVRFEGVQPPAVVKSWLERASVFCLPSVTARNGETEGLPISVLEAQSMGLPVVATAHAGTPDAVLDGETGLLVPERDVERLGTAIERLLLDEQEARRIAARAREHVRANFDLRKQTTKLETLYDEVASR